MGRTLLYDKSGLAALIARQNGLITRAQAMSCGLTDQALRVRLRAGGPWQALIPGVYATFTGAATPDQNALAALLYAGPRSAITGQAAMAAHGISNLGRTVVDVLIPASCRRRDQSFVRVVRTWRMPGVVFKAGELRYVPVARAVADAARQARDIGDVRSLVASAVQWRKVTVAELAAELEQGQTAGSARFRAALAEVAAGVRSVAEGDLRKLIRRSGLPEPLYNPRLYVGGKFVGCPDAWWPDADVVVEVDSRQWHLSPADWARTMARYSRMSALGITVLPYPPRRIAEEPRMVVAEISEALEVGRGRPRLPIRTEPGH
ncbi:MAG TPA: hypothetical protein VF162_08045 [Streptosporangiaceae bacterium]